ncbi:MAG: histidine kinase dimerization/phospho-acceptor domain-containing protein, partial [Planctomycetota bacterium]
MSSSRTQQPGTVPTPIDVEGAICAFTKVLAELQESHADLAARAERVEAELSRTNEELAAILSSLPTGVVVRDAQGHVVRVNEAALAILDCPREALLGQTDWPGLEGSRASGETHAFVREDGKHIALQNRHSTVRRPDGVETGSVEILDDRTALQAMSQRLHELDKMAALGTMAGGIAHEIRNPLNAVKGFAALLAGQLPADSKHARWAGLIQEGVDECNAIIGSMLTFADPERLQLETIQARELVNDALAAVRRDLAADSGDRRYEFTVHADDMCLVGDRIKLRQALRNLVANAIEAQPQGGRVLISVTELE